MMPGPRARAYRSIEVKDAGAREDLSLEVLTPDQALRADRQWRRGLLLRNTGAGSCPGTGLAGVSSHPARWPGEITRRPETSSTVDRRFRSGHTSQFPDNDAQGPDLVMVRNHNEAAVSRGIIEAFVNTCRRWNLEENQELILLGPRGTDSFGKPLLRGLVRVPSRDQEARIRHVLLISLGLEILFRNDTVAENAWLRCPQAGLGGSSPLDYMLRGDMVRLLTVAEIVKRERGL